MGHREDERLVNPAPGETPCLRAIPIRSARTRGGASVGDARPAERSAAASCDGRAMPGGHRRAHRNEDWAFDPRRRQLPLRAMRVRPLPSATLGSASWRAAHDHEALDLAAQEGLKEPVVVAERHAAVRIAARTQHVGVRQQADAAVDRLAAADRREPDRPHAVEQLLALGQIVGAGRRRPAHPHVDEAGIVQALAEAGMRLQALAIRQRHGPGGDVVDGDPGRRARLAGRVQAAGRCAAAGPRPRACSPAPHKPGPGACSMPNSFSRNERSSGCGSGWAAGGASRRAIRRSDRRARPAPAEFRNSGRTRHRQRDDHRGPRRRGDLRARPRNWLPGRTRARGRAARSGSRPSATGIRRWPQARVRDPGSRLTLALGGGRLGAAAVRDRRPGPGRAGRATTVAGGRALRFRVTSCRRRPSRWRRSAPSRAPRRSAAQSGCEAVQRHGFDGHADAHAPRRGTGHADRRPPMPRRNHDGRTGPAQAETAGSGRLFWGDAMVDLGSIETIFRRIAVYWLQSSSAD